MWSVATWGKAVKILTAHPKKKEMELAVELNIEYRDAVRIKREWNKIKERVNKKQ